MKSTFIYFLLVGFIFMSSEVYAQQADQIQRGQRGYVPPPKISTSTYIEIKDPHEQASIILPKLTEEFNLDAFEQEIIKGIIIKKVEDENVILQDDKNTREDRKEKLKILNNQLYKDLGSILSQDEVETFKTMDFTLTREERKEKKKKKKRRNKN